MAITASQVGTANTLEQFRVEYNNLQTDVSGLESGTLSYTALSATTISVSELTVTSSLSSVSFIFEGDTDDDFETTLTVTDPTADRTITLPNETGTVHTSGGDITLGGDISKASNLTFDVEGDISLDANGGDIYLKDNGTIFATFSQNGGNLIIKNSSAEEAAITIAGDEVVTFADDLVIKDGGTIGVSSATTAITIAASGAVTLAGDLTVSGDDITMGTNTSGAALIADGTNFNPVVISGDATIATNGALTIASTAIESGMLNANIISGQTEITSVDLTNDDLLILDATDGALKKVAATNLGFTTDDPTALAIALG